MIKNKELIEIIESKKKEVSCENCRFCDLGAYHKGKWYCIKHSVFTKPDDTMECFEKRLNNKNGKIKQNT